MKKAEIDKRVEEIKASGHQATPNTAIQNNYYHYNIQISPQELSVLAGKDPAVAQKYLDLQEKQLEHAKETDSRILSLEEKEQAARHAEQPHFRKYFTRGQYFAFGTIAMGLGAAVLLGFAGMEKAAIACVVVAGGTVAAQFLGGTRNRKE